MYLGPCWQDGGNVIPVNQGWLPGEIKDGSQRFVGWVCQRTITSEDFLDLVRPRQKIPRPL